MFIGSIILILCDYFVVSIACLILSILLVIYVIVVKLFHFFDMMLEAGFRNRFPMDFRKRTILIENYFEKQGFSFVECGNLGSERPFVKFDKLGQPLFITLVAPLSTNSKESIEISLSSLDNPNLTFSANLDPLAINQELAKYFENNNIFTSIQS